MAIFTSRDTNSTTIGMKLACGTSFADPFPNVGRVAATSPQSPWCRNLVIDLARLYVRFIFSRRRLHFRWRLVCHRRNLKRSHLLQRWSGGFASHAYRRRVASWSLQVARCAHVLCPRSRFYPTVTARRRAASRAVHDTCAACRTCGAWRGRLGVALHSWTGFWRACANRERSRN